MGKFEPLAPSKRVRIVLCSAAFAIAAIAPGAGFAADWSSGITAPTADWSSGCHLAGRRLVVEQAFAQGRLVVEQAFAEGRLVVEQGRSEGRLELSLPGERTPLAPTPPNGGGRPP